VAALAVAAPAQDRDAPASMHAAWLVEVMDLDVPRAITGYQRVAADVRPGHLERWIATARLLELRRLQAAAIPPPDVGEAPAALRPLFQAAASELPTAELLARVRGEPKDVLQQISTDAGRLPVLRSVVPGAEEWLMSQIGPSLRDRWRQRMASFATRARGSEATNERIYAADVLRAELQGQTAQANALRTLYFADWRPPSAAGDPGPHLARARARLDTMLATDALPATQAAMLRELAEAIDQRAATSPATALAFVRRLPIYAERLLGPEPTGR